MKKVFSWVEQHWIFSLFLLATCIYGPFMGFRVIRMAGDEKVYVSQALEMIRDGRWFLQTLADEPNYFKGPFHYLAIRLGFSLFGYSMWSTLYMNFILVLGGAWAMAALIRSRLPQWQEGPFMIGASLILGLGVYSHAFASQMEAELVGLFAMALFCLDRSENPKFHFLFWMIAGMVGTIKSPLHSMFLGITANLFWIIQGQWVRRMREGKTWLFLFLGILLCCGAFAPAYFLDRENFVRAYILRENWNKSTAGDPWEWTLIPLLSFFIFPWMFQSFVSWFQWIQKKTFRKMTPLTGSEKKLIHLGLSLLLPSVIFFLLHTYRFQNYNLPVVSGLLLILAVLYDRFRYSSWYSFAHGITLGVGLIVISFALFLFYTFQEVWVTPTFLLVLSGLTLLAFLGTFLFLKYRVQGSTPYFIAISFQYLCFGAVLAFLGEHEMSGVRAALASECGRGKNLAYYDLHRNDWSEWGYLNFMLGQKVEGAHRPKALESALKRGDLILIPAEKKEEFEKFLKSSASQSRGRFISWKRWRTHGKDERGKSLFSVAWEQKRFSPLEKDAWIFIDDDCTSAGEPSS